MTIMTKRCFGKSCWIITAAIATVLPGQISGEEGTRLKDRVPEIQACIADNYEHLESLYKHFHTHPELSLQEVQTAARLVQELRALGFEVTPNVGGHGVVAVLQNGAGPTGLVRTDMDALPVVEH